MDRHKFKIVMTSLVMFFLILFFNSLHVSAIDVYDESGLIKALESSGNQTVVVKNSISLNTRIDISSNKTLDLDNNIIIAATGKFKKSGGFNLSASSNLTDFTVKNGTLAGGPDVGLGGYNNEAGLIYADSNAYNLTVTAQNITHTNSGFFKGRSSDIVFKGKMQLKNSYFNARALNIMMYGNPDDPNDPDNVDFYGYVDASGNGSQDATGTAGLNLSFDGRSENSAAKVGVPNKILSIPKNAKVKLKNDSVANLDFMNNVGNFSQLNLDGELEAEAEGSSLRTTSSLRSGDAGTKSDQAEINVNPGSIFKIATLNSRVNTGVIYTYSLDINVNDPLVFDIKTLSSGLFFKGWSGRNDNNFRLYNTDVAVWSKVSKGVGNPVNLWQNVDWLTLENFYYNMKDKAYFQQLNSSNSDIQQKFYLNDYSRISNDVTLPTVVPDKSFQKNGNYRINNNQTSLYGKANYLLPDGTVSNTPASNAFVSIKVGAINQTVLTDSQGNWRFDKLDLSKISGGTSIELSVTDLDKRSSRKPAMVIVDDKTPPKAKSKLVKTLLKDYSFISSAANAITAPTDETSSSNEMTKKFVDSANSLKEKAETFGLKELPVSLSDKAGNEVIIPSKLLVTDTLTASGLVIGHDFKVPYEEWLAMSDAQKRQKIIELGEVTGWSVIGDTVTDVTSDTAKLLVTYDKSKWKPLDIVDITLAVGNYSKKIKVTLDIKEFKTTIKYLDKNDKVIAPTLEENLLPVTNYTRSAAHIPGYQVVKVVEDNEESRLVNEDNIEFEMGSAEKNIIFYYQEIQFKPDLLVDAISTAQREKLNYSLTVSSGMEYDSNQSVSEYKNFTIDIPISENLESISKLVIKNEKNEEVGSGSYNETTKSMIGKLTKSVKNTEKLTAIFTAQVKNEAKTGQVITEQARVVADYEVNNKIVKIEKKSNKVSTKIVGGLKLVSAPDKIDFGEMNLTDYDSVVGVGKHDIHQGEGLIVEDTREEKAPWVLNAVVLKDMTLNGATKNDVILKDALMYHYNNQNMVLHLGQPTTVFDSNNQNNSVNLDEMSLYRISDKWDKSNEKDGLKLKSQQIPDVGTYNGVIEWRIEDTVE